MNITISNDTCDEENDVILSGHQIYNRQFSSGAVEALSVISRNDDNRIVGAAEKEGMARGCIGVTLDTYSFQALASI